MKNLITDKPLFSLTVAEYVELQQSLLRGFPQQFTQAEQKELLTIQEAADFLHLSVPTLYTMNSKGRIPFTKVSGKVYYRRTALLQWLESGERKTNAQLRKEIQEG
ncbi:MAG TPA: helix-turn-helix domain-containing protein [Tenuifilaceae bacterium]|nr:helix-turn-helix domain-containing protein [Tenuifilaceae bacterium]